MLRNKVFIWGTKKTTEKVVPSFILRIRQQSKRKILFIPNRLMKIESSAMDKHKKQVSPKSLFLKTILYSPKNSIKESKSMLLCNEKLQNQTHLASKESFILLLIWFKCIKGENQSMKTILIYQSINKATEITQPNKKNILNENVKKHLSWRNLMSDLNIFVLSSNPKYFPVKIFFAYGSLLSSVLKNPNFSLF